MQPSAISIATRADLPGVLELVRQCALLEQGIAEVIHCFSVVRSSAAVVGCAGLEVHGDFGLLRSVAVRDSARRAGLGTQLVESIAVDARARGLSHLFLLTTTAARFFERCGYHAVQRSAVPLPIAESWEFRVGCPQTAVAMRFDLREA